MKDIEKQKKYVTESLRRKSIVIEGEQKKLLEDNFEKFDMVSVIKSVCPQFYSTSFLYITYIHYTTSLSYQ